MGRHVRWAAVAVAVAIALTGCASTATAGTSGAAGQTGPTSASPTSSGDALTFTLLPESVLAPLPPLTYQQSATADQQLVASGAKPAVALVFSGGIARTVLYQGSPVGGVELYRFSPAVTADKRASFVPFMVRSFAQVEPVASKIGTTPVQVADGARGTAGAVIGWTRGDDVVLAWGNDPSAATRIATEYLQISG